MPSVSKKPWLMHERCFGKSDAAPHPSGEFTVFRDDVEGEDEKGDLEAGRERNSGVAPRQLRLGQKHSGNIRGSFILGDWADLMKGTST